MIGKLIGIGNTADVYEWGTNQIMKLFRKGYPADAVTKEFNNAKAVEESNIDKPKVYSLMEWEGRLGIIYERLQGITLLEWFMQTGDTEACAKMLAEEHKKLLNNKINGVRKHKEILKKYLGGANELSVDLKNHLMERLESLPEGDTLCHGDFHPGNIMLCQEKRKIIDWMNVCSGHPLSDIARTVYLIEMTAIPEEIEDKETFQKIRSQVTDLYLNEMDVDRNSIKEWLMIIAAARLKEGCNQAEAEGVLTFLQQANL